jgi:CRP/FNR family transcriptional regulator
VQADKKELLRQTALFHDLDDSILDFLAQGSAEKRLTRDEILFLAGEEAAGLYVILDGSVRAFRTATDGREQVIHVEKAVTTIAEVPVFDNGMYPSTVAAEEESRVLFIAKEKVQAACLKHPQLALAAARLFASRLRQCAELVESLSLREVGQRLAQFLLEQAEKSGAPANNGITFRQDLTHNQLAARIGTVREVVSRVMFRLQQQGLLTAKGRILTIPDRAALERYAGMEER